MSRKAEPVHPGEVLQEEFLLPMGLSHQKVAADIGVPPRRIPELVQGQRGITPDTALRLARYFGTSPEFRTNLQNHHDLEKVRDQLGSRLVREVRALVPAKTAAR